MLERDPIALLHRYAVQFQDKGTEWVVVECAFHNDTHDNISDCHGGISKVSGKFHCFSCGANGTIISYLATKYSCPESTLEAHIQNFLQKPKAGSIDDSVVESYHKELLANDIVRSRLLAQHGITEEGIRQFRLGWLFKSQRIQIPVKDGSGKYINIRSYKYDAESPDGKVVGLYKGGGGLFPVSALDSEIIYITEGEFKAIILWQYGFNAITGTVGAGTWKGEWSACFQDKHVVILLDVDKAGRNGAAKICYNLYPFAKSIKNVYLRDVQHIDKGDITNYFVDCKKTREDLIKLIDETDYYAPPSATSRTVAVEDNVPYELKLAKTSEAEYNLKLVKTVAVVSAKDTSPYIIPKSIRVSCTRDRDYCRHCHVYTNPDYKFDIPESSPMILDLINTNDRAKAAVLKQASRIYPNCKAATFVDEGSRNVEEVRLIPQIAIGHTSEEQVTRRAYYVGHGLGANNTYLLTARVCAEPSSGHATLLAYAAESTTDDLDKFTLKEDLSLFNPVEWTADAVKAKLEDIYDDLENNVTKIYQRRDLHLFYDLAWHSVLYIPFQGREIKGWADVLVIGDSGQGKSECSSRLSIHYKCGERVDTKRASVAGLVGGLQETSDRWFISWGTIPLNDRRLVLLEEIKGIGVTELSKMTDMRSSGIAEIIKIERAKTTARTRLIWISNPRSDSNLATYNYGVDAVKELIGTLEDIRRFDMVMAVATGEVPQLVVNSIHRSTIPHIYTSDLCSHLVTWGWSRKPAQIIIECEQEILAAAMRMGQKYSSACPIVEPSDQRLKLTRLATALAVRTFSTDDTNENVIVRKCHIQVVEEFLDRIYSSRALGYKEFSDAQRGETMLMSEEETNKILRDAPNAADMVRGMIELDLIRPEDVMNMCEFTVEEAGKFIGLLSRHGCLRRHRRGGYRKTSAFIDLLKKLDRSGTLSSKSMRELLANGEM